MKRLKDVWQHYRATIGFIILAGMTGLTFFAQEQERDERTYQICSNAIAQQETIILASQQNPRSEPADPKVLQLYRQLGKSTLPPICQERYEELRADVLKTLTVNLKKLAQETQRAR